MSFQLIDSVAAVGTFIVIAATAIAAVIHLRHLRVSNQLQGLLTVLARVEDANFNHRVDQARGILNDRLRGQIGCLHCQASRTARQATL